MPYWRCPHRVLCEQKNYSAADPPIFETHTGDLGRSADRSQSFRPPDAAYPGHDHSLRLAPGT